MSLAPEQVDAQRSKIKKARKRNKQVVALISMIQGNFVNESAYCLYPHYHSVCPAGALISNGSLLTSGLLKKNWIVTCRAQGTACTSLAHKET